MSPLLNRGLRPPRASRTDRLPLYQHELVKMSASAAQIIPNQPALLGPECLRPPPASSALQHIDWLREIRHANVLGKCRVLALDCEEHLPGHAAIAEVAGYSGS